MAVAASRRAANLFVYGVKFRRRGKMEIAWNKSLATGNTEIDNQHKELFSRFADLLTACNERKGREEVLNMFSFLDKYVREHFALEEKLQLQYDYPGYAGHKSQHDSFITELQQLERQLTDDGATLMLVIKTNQAMARWLINHVNDEDRKLADFLRPKI
jgi:hemerythrin